MRDPLKPEAPQELGGSPLNSTHSRESPEAPLVRDTGEGIPHGYSTKRAQAGINLLLEESK